jgi:RimJ/RimL family protein N-acetyltransferase
MIIETSRLRIRRLTLEDAEFVFGLVNEPAFIANIGDKGVRTLEDAKRFISKGPWTCQEKRGYGQFLVCRKQDGEPVGICGLLFRDVINVTDVGFAILAEHRGRGFAFEAASAVMNYGVAELQIEEIVGLTSVDNTASIRVLEKLGMKFNGVVKMSDDDPGTAVYRCASPGVRDVRICIKEI